MVLGLLVVPLSWVDFRCSFTDVCVIDMHCQIPCTLVPGLRFRLVMIRNLVPNDLERFEERALFRDDDA